MLKYRFAVTAIALALLVALAPTPSHAAPWGWSPASPAGLFERIGDWWNQAFRGTERVTPLRPAAARPKIGCGIDPNGQPLCNPGPGAGSGLTATAPAADPEG
jgi:hypothetical protein